METLSLVLRSTGIGGALVALAFLIAPVDVKVSPIVAIEAGTIDYPGTVTATHADSLTEDIILNNLFSPTRTFPDRRHSVAAPGFSTGQMEAFPAATTGGGAFGPVLIGTSVSERPGETRALLQLSATDPTPRLYSVGEGAGGYRVVSIEPREVVVAGPRGRVVLRLTQEDNS